MSCVFLLLTPFADNINFYHSRDAKYLRGYHFHAYWIIRNPLQNSDEVVKTGQQMLQKGSKPKFETP